MTCTPVECSATKEGATDGLPSTASRTDTPDLPADFEPYTQSTYLLIDPVGSPVDADSAWARITLDDTGTISVARALLPLLSLRFGTPYQTTSVQEQIPVLGTTGEARFDVEVDEWGPGGNGYLVQDYDGRRYVLLRFWARVGYDTFDEAMLLCDPDGPQRLVCWWNGLGLPGPALEPEYFRPDHFPRLVWDRYDTLADIPQTSPAQAIEQYVLFGEGA
jgi:hypothetical protein